MVSKTTSTAGTVYKWQKSQFAG